MFILRRITSEGSESNHLLGKSYNVVTQWNENDKFSELIAPWPSPEEIFGFIIYDDGANVAPLYKKSEYYLMCSDGKTFDKIRYK